MSSPTKTSRIKGALLGLHAGDSLGATLEFHSWDEIHATHPTGLREIIGGGHFGWTPGHATDDTDLTRAVLLAYRDVAKARASGNTNARNLDVVKIAAQNMVDWYDGRWPDRTRGDSPVDVGGATAIGIRRFKSSGDPSTSGAGEGQAGNGSLMRCLPTGLFQEDTDLLIAESKAISAVTHNDMLCTLSCVAYNVMARALVAGRTVGEAVQEGKDIIGACVPADQGDAKLALAAKRVVAAIEGGRALVRVDDLARNGPKAAANGPKILPFKGSGYVLESLAIAVAALLDPRSLEDVLVDVVKIGKDTDTNGAIAGGLLGARDGLDAIPQRWREKLQFGSEFAEMVDEILSLHTQSSTTTE